MNVTDEAKFLKGWANGKPIVRLTADSTFWSAGKWMTKITTDKAQALVDSGFATSNGKPLSAAGATIRMK